MKELKRRHEHEIQIIGYPRDLHGNGGTITVDPQCDDFILRGNESGSLIARCASAKRLSDWAFAQGAQLVRHEYDLALADREA